MEQRYEQITVRDLVKSYTHNGALNDENKVTAFDGKLCIRPEYQREFVYCGKDEYKMHEVIRTILKNCCLGIFTWSDNGDGTYECLDGQQRTISICEFIDDKYTLMYSGKRIGYGYLSEEERNKILNYKILINVVTGTEEEKLEWFRTINIAGTELNNQELRNAIYHSAWLTSAKSYFSRLGSIAKKKYSGYIDGVPERQEVLETAIKYVSMVDEDSKGDDEGIVKYMCDNMKEENANSFWASFQRIMDWAKDLFEVDEKTLKTQSQNWGKLYKEYSMNEYDAEYIKRRVEELKKDEDITNYKGIVEYILSSETDEKFLNIRVFDNKMKRMKWEEQGHTCCFCNKEITLGEARGDHIKPWILGGKTEYLNLQILCPECNGRKGARY